MTESTEAASAAEGGEPAADDGGDANLTGILQGRGEGRTSEATVTSRKLNRARSMYIRGDQVGGDKFVLRVGGAEPAPLREVDVALSDPVRHAFVDPEEWDRTRTAIHERRLVILRGGPGHGRQAAAIRLLQIPSDRPIYQLERDVDLQRFPHWLESDAATEKPLPIGAGFLLNDPMGKDRLDGWVLHQIATALEQRDARMVLTLDVDLVLNDDDARDFAVALGRPRPHRDILESHLRWRLTERFDGEVAAAMTARILADEQVAEVIAAAFADGVPVKVAANLALMIDQQFDGERVDVERLRSQHAERAADNFSIWFGALPDVRSRSMAIALAVLNGLHYEHVARAARKLNDLLDGPPQVVADSTPMLQPPWRDPFTTSRSEMLRMLRARTRETIEFGNFGPTPIEVIEYIDRDRPRSVLNHVWHEYQFQRPILEWLRDLATTPSLDVRTYVGTALGVLSTYAFDFVHNHALQPMALDDNSWSWDVVAYALRIPAEDSRFYHPVRRMANRLHGNSDNPQAQATSARIRGHALAPIFLEPALIKLDALAIVNDWRVAWAIGNSAADLLVEDADRYGPVLLSRIARWQGDPRRTLSAQYVFQHVAQNVLWYVDVGKNGEQETEIWPGLLFLADRRPELRPMLVTCWVRLLNSSVMEPFASEALNNWADWADSYADVLTAFIRLLKAVAATSPRTRAIVLRHAESWDWPDALFRLPDTTAAVTQALKARTEG